MHNYIALGFLIFGLFLIISMIWADYHDSKIIERQPYRNGAGGAIVLLFGVFCLVISLIIKLAF